MKNPTKSVLSYEQASALVEKLISTAKASNVEADICLCSPKSNFYGVKIRMNSADLYIENEPKDARFLFAFMSLL